MKLARKLAALMLLGMLLVMAVALFTSVQREIKLFDTDMKRDHRALGSTLATSIARIWVTEGEQGASELISRVNADEESPRAAFLKLSRQGWRNVPLARDGIEQFETTGEDRFPSLVTRVLVKSEGDWLFVVELRESTGSRHLYVQSTILRALLTAAGITVVAGIAAVIVGIDVVGHRVNALVRFTRAFGAGDTDARIVTQGDDELSEIAVALNRMAGELQVVQSSLRQASEAKIRALEQLRHADRLATVGKLASGICSLPVRPGVLFHVEVTGLLGTCCAAGNGRRSFGREGHRRT